MGFKVLLPSPVLEQGWLRPQAPRVGVPGAGRQLLLATWAWHFGQFMAGEFSSKLRYSRSPQMMQQIAIG